MLLKKKIYLFENILFIVHHMVPKQSLLYQRFHEMSGFVKLRAVSKLSTFLCTLYLHQVYDIYGFHLVKFVNSVKCFGIYLISNKKQAKPER